jgi:hypothetical protein
MLAKDLAFYFKSQRNCKLSSKFHRGSSGSRQEQQQQQRISSKNK